MTSAVDKLRRQRDQEKMNTLVRELGIKIRATARSMREARLVYDQIPKEDIPELLSRWQDVMNWQVRHRVLVEIWELATSHVWPSGIQDG